MPTPRTPDGPLPPGSLADQLTRLLEARKMTAQQVADASGLSVDGVRNLLRARSTAPRATTLQRIADVLGIASSELMAGFAGPDSAPAGAPEGWADVPQLEGLELEAGSLLAVLPFGHWRMPVAALSAKKLRASETVIVHLSADESPVHKMGDYILVDAVPGLLPPRRGGWVVVRDRKHGFFLAEYRRAPGGALDRNFILHDGDGAKINPSKANVVGLVVGKLMP